MLQLSINTNLKEFKRDLNDFAQRQIPFATSLAINAMAKQAVADVQQNMTRTFDRPTPFTLKAFYARPGTKRTQAASIEARDFASKGTPAWKYLAPEMTGGPRGQKRFEKALGNAIGIGGGLYAVPGRGAPLDAYGNISRGMIRQILSRVGAAGDQNISAKTTKRLRRKGLTVAATQHRSDYFIAKSKSDGTPLGVYRLVGPGKVEPVLIFLKHSPSYRPIFHYTEVVTQSLQKNAAVAFDQAFEKAMATAR